MHRQLGICIFMLIVLFSVAFLYAADFTAKQPILITSAGQSVDALMIKILAEQAGLKFTYNQLAQSGDLSGHETLLFVSGGSTKGLGAAGIDKEQELVRVQSLIEEAQKLKKQIVTMHVGGKNRRGSLSDTFNKLTAENAHCLIIDKDGDEDNLFGKIATDREIPIYYIEIIKEAGDILKNIVQENSNLNY